MLLMDVVDGLYPQKPQEEGISSMQEILKEFWEEQDLILCPQD